MYLPGCGCFLFCFFPVVSLEEPMCLILTKSVLSIFSFMILFPNPRNKLTQDFLSCFIVFTLLYMSVQIRSFQVNFPMWCEIRVKIFYFVLFFYMNIHLLQQRLLKKIIFSLVNKTLEPLLKNRVYPYVYFWILYFGSLSTYLSLGCFHHTILFWFPALLRYN